MNATDHWEQSGLDPHRVTDVATRESREFSRRTRVSAAALKRARVRMPRGVPMGWMADLYPDPPIFVQRGEGSRFWDVDGNEYVDFNLCDLSMPCGYAPEQLNRTLSDQAGRGVQFLLPTEDAVVVAVEMEKRFRLPAWQFTLSSSLANTEALRLSRAFTGRDRVLVFGGRYHGHLAETLQGMSGGSREVNYLGLPKNAGDQTAVVAFNDLAAVQAELSGGDVAAVLVEPVLTNCTVVMPDPGFHAGLRELCDRHNALLILDETHTQFAVWGGGTTRFDLDPDVVTAGKGLAGGIPIGAYGMTAQLAEFMEEHPDSDFASNLGVATGGTMFANVLSIAAARTVLTELLTPARYVVSERLGGDLADGLDAQFERVGLDWSAHRLGTRSGYCLRPSLPRTLTEAEHSLIPTLAAARRAFFANRGVWDAIATSGPSVSTAHSRADVDLYISVAGEFLDAVTQ